MHILWSLVTLPAALAPAQNLDLDKKTPLGFMRRGLPFTNVTAPESNLTPTTVTSFTPTGTYTDQSTPSSFGPPTSLPHDFTNSTSSTTTYTNTPTESSTCTGSVTYYGSVPPTVYVTVTEGFNVTVTASNASMTETPTLVTPLPACQATIMPLAGTIDPEYSLSASADSFGPAKTGQPEAGTFNGGNNPQVVTGGAPTPAVSEGPSPDAFSTAPSSAVYSSVDYTSTVIVTKKTPVTVVAPPTTSPDVNFQSPPPTPTRGESNPPSNGGGGGSNNNDNNNPPSDGSNNGGASPGPGAPNNPSPIATNANFPSVSNNLGPGLGTLVAVPPTTTGLGNIIASIINSPFATASPTPPPSITTTINNVPVVILPSNVVIGSQTVAIPTSAPTVVEANGVSFTVRPSEIVAPAGTITIPPIQQDEAVTSPVPSSTITTAVGQLTFTVGPTVAIISGTTYRIGQGAPATTITVDGTQVSIGSNGVGLPSTTLGPGGVAGSPFIIYTVEGLTFSVDSSEAVVSGTTYRIGSNAPQIITTIGGESVSFGPGGVGLESTTIIPTAASSKTTKSSSKSTSALASATQSASPSSDGSSKAPRPFSELSGWYLMAMPLVWFVL
ncbi:uncharacterized protein Z518_10975 [Rhinocladiella mackenziei CBS 650.93]|uniref:Uncharacterized protein n=1 Tax=Rhinocladiella mackenziei CBS 650.93 TaxID=1442369 RepID=A0A0D2GP03_9EURO|nr:uncharacterized protein Z518_10975 [Rhinocladiella mackenziei CBS 650.93]KIX00048.1 hypothetical protein Z518_10975 [Rhinocladiella mackenziei CBS 650.93]